jgi:hypothetical protein
VRLNARKRTFLIATSVCGKQFRMMLGHWPLMTVSEARKKAMDVLRLCRDGAPRFMLHDLRKLVATAGEKLGLGDAVLRRILNHTAPKRDVLHRHCVGLSEKDVAGALVRIQVALAETMSTMIGQAVDYRLSSNLNQN